MLTSKTQINMGWRVFFALVGMLALTVEAQTVIPQQGANPVVINQTASMDNMVMITAASAERLSDMTVAGGPRPKHGYVTGFVNSSQYLKWRVNVPSGASYNVRLLMNPGASNQSYALQVDSGTTTSFTVADNHWARVEAGSIFLPAGTSEITLRRNSLSGTSEVKSLELMRSDLQSGFNSRVAAFNAASAASTASFSSKPWGVMFQYGPWGYALDGSQKSVNAQAADFDVPAFVSMIKSTGAHYVIWSATWWTYEISAPIQAVDNIVGNGNRTASRDLIGDIAAGLAAEGIDFHMYYHTGQDSHLGWESTDWWREQDWPGEFQNTGLGDRSTFFNNWIDVISEMGNRYGTLLKGWYFDDGRAYYPGNFEELAAAARAGNSSRLISYNNAGAANITDFADMAFGEPSPSSSRAPCLSGDIDIGGDGTVVRGSEKGLSGHCMYKLDDGWGVFAPDNTTSTNFSVSQAYSTVQSNLERGVPTSFDIMMWEDGTVWAPTLAVLQGLGELIGNPTSECGENCTRLNNTDSSISYAGAWAVSSNRNKGDYLDDLQYTRNDGDSASITFTGTAIRLYMPLYSSYGDFEVFIDGASRGIFNATGGSTYEAQVNTYSVSGLASGTHTLQIVKRSGGYLQLDYLEIDNTPTAGPDKLVHMKKRNMSGFAIDGNRGAIDGQVLYIWTSNTANVNQQWVEIDRGSGYYSYQKRNTNLCIDGQPGGAIRQDVILDQCSANDHDQHWKKVDSGAGHYRLEKRNAPEYSIDGNNGGDDGQFMYLWNSSSTNQNQQWFFTNL